MSSCREKWNVLRSVCREALTEMTNLGIGDKDTIAELDNRRNWKVEQVKVVPRIAYRLDAELS